MIHSHSEDDHVGHGVEWLVVSAAHHVLGSHHSDDVHAHRVGWSQMQLPAASREISGPVLVAEFWLVSPASMMSAQNLIRPLPQAAVSERAHAPPPLHRSMVFLI